MRASIEIENIEEMRRQRGIDDIELRDEIRELHAGDLVKLTFLTSTKSCETLLVRITSIRGATFRGKLASKPSSTGLSNLHAGSPITFTSDHIHSIARRQPSREAGN